MGDIKWKLKMAEMSLTFGLSGSTESRRWLAVRPYDGWNMRAFALAVWYFHRHLLFPLLSYCTDCQALRSGPMNTVRASEMNDVSVAVFGHYSSKLHCGIFIGRHI